MAELKWIKITTDIFDDEKISLIEQMPEGDTIIVIWFKLLALAGKKNDSGLIYISKDIPYTEDTLPVILRRKKQIVTLALQILEKLKMIEIIDDIITILNWEKYQNTDKIDKIREQNRVRQQKYRDKQRKITQKITLRDAPDKKRKDINNDSIESLKKHIQEYFKIESPEFFKTKTDYQREGNAIKRLANDINTRIKDKNKQTEFFDKAVKTFKNICNNGIGKNKFLQGTAYIPSKMFSQGIWIEIIKEMNKKEKSQKPDYSSYKED